MALVMAFVFVSSDIPTKAEAAERVYISEVMIFYGNDLADAVNECKKAGYIPVESDLNETAYEDQPSFVRKHAWDEVHEIYGDIGNAVVLGYKTTKQRELAITNLSMLQMGIGYDNYKYEEYMKLKRGNFDFMVRTIIGVRKEFSDNLAKGSSAARMALQIMNFYKYYEENMLLGDYILSDQCGEDELSYLFQHCNSAVANTVFGAMTGAVADFNPDTEFAEGKFETEVQPAEPIPDIELSENSGEEMSVSDFWAAAEDSSSETEGASDADEASAADTLSEDTSFVEETAQPAESSSESADGIFVFYTTEDTVSAINQPKEITDSDNSGKFISKIMLSVAESETEAKTSLTRKGFKIIDENLTPDIEKSYTYLGYKVQTVAEEGDTPITDIRIATKTKDAAQTYGNAGYAIAGLTNDKETGSSGTLKNGDSMYYSSYACVGDALTTDFMIVRDVKDAKEGYEPITTFGGLPYNFNHVLDFEISSLMENQNSLFESGLDVAKQKLGTPLYVFFRPSKTYTKSEIEKNGGTAQEYLSGIAIYECLPHRSGKIGNTDWDINTYTEYIKYYAELTGAEVYENNLLDGVVYERGWNDIANFTLSPGTPKCFFLVTKTYNPKRAVYGIRSYTSSPSASVLPSSAGSVATGAYAAAEVTLATTARPSYSAIRAFYSSQWL